jgi:hypothetical protein
MKLFDDTGPPAFAALGFFGTLLSQYQGELGVYDACPHAPKTLLEIVSKTLVHATRGRPDRSEVLQFCLNECVLPDEIHAAWLTTSSPVPGWLDRAVADVALSTVCRACRLFRA